MNVLFSTQPIFIPVIKQLSNQHQCYTLHAQFSKLLEDSGVSAPSIAAAREVRQSDEDIRRRAEIVADLGVSGVRFLGPDGRTIHYSSFPTDAVTTARGLTYKNFDEVDSTFPAAVLALAGPNASGSGAATW